MPVIPLPSHLQSHFDMPCYRARVAPCTWANDSYFLCFFLLPRSQPCPHCCLFYLTFLTRFWGSFCEVSR